MGVVAARATAAAARGALARAAAVCMAAVCAAAVGAATAGALPPPCPGDDATAQPAVKPTAAEAEAQAAAWIDRLGDRGLVLDESFDDGGFTVRYGDSAVGRVTKFELEEPGWRVSFTFRGEHTPTTPLAELRKAFWHAVIDRVPTPDLGVPGWETWPLTPTSSFNQGVELVSLADGRATFCVKTEFFAISGRDPTVLVPADAPAPPGSFFQLRRRFPLDLTISAPVAFPR